MRAVISLYAVKAGVVLHHNNRVQKSDPNKNRKSKSKKIRIQDPEERLNVSES